MCDLNYLKEQFEKLEFINTDNEHTEIHIRIIIKPSYYGIYGIVIFCCGFLIFGWFGKNKHLEDVVADINEIIEVDDEKERNG